MGNQFLPAIQQLRAIVFGYTLFFIGGYQSRNDFARGGDCWWRQRHPCRGLENKKPNAKWFGLLRGAWPRKACVAELMEDFPLLADVAEDPLWGVLGWEDGLVDLAERFIRRVRLNDAPLFPFSNERMEILCGCPDWRRLSYLVALLRTQAPRYVLHKLWLRKNFSCYVQLVCLTPPCCACCSELFRQLHALYLLGRLGAVDHWPKDLEAFHLALEEHELLWETLAEMKWFDEWDTFSVAMLWHVSAEHRLLISRFAQGRCDCPVGLLQRVRTTLSTHTKTLITLID